MSGLATGCLDRKVVTSEPQTSNIFVDQIVQTSVNKIDLLFMVDNSASMADKQDILRAAVPVLVGRLVSPICVDANGAPTGGNSDANGNCATGQPEFTPIADIHVGIVTSSLGSHGGTVCAAPAPSAGQDNPLNDNGQLLGAIRPAGSNPDDPTAVFPVANTWNNSGFLAWDPGGKDVPPGSTDATAFGMSFADMIHASGQIGCGYEAQLEGWYRFLVDPEPPVNVSKVGNSTVRGSTLVVNSDGTTTCNGCDQTLLAQRAAFLRPDSLVAIVMLTDENDCSIVDEGVGWFVSTSGLPMPRATAACAANPNDPCCRSCAQNETTPPAGCMPLSQDSVCGMVPAGQAYATWDTLHDSLNMRCFDQQQRFGFNLLYPTDRYVTGLTSTTLTLQSDGKTVVTNPLYATGGSNISPRDPSLVFLAGIVGVPWQDIADAPSLTGPGLNYLTATDLVSQNRWPMLLGDPTASPPVPPSDPFMVESLTPRMGNNPITNDPIVPATSMNPTASPINGHEQNPVDMGDLEFACTFALATPKTCMPGDEACDCAATKAGDLSQITAYNSPLCQPPAGGAPTNIQSYAKAYPGARELQVLKDFGANGIVASICPKVTTSSNPSSDPNYGYNPAVGAIIERLKQALNGKCLPRALTVDPTTNQVPCEVVEAQKTGCDCTIPGRAPVDPTIVPAVEAQLQSAGTCGNAGQVACSTFCECEILQETGSDLTQCVADQTSGVAPGYCYINNPASPALTNCPANQKQILRFVSDSSHPTPAAGAVAFIACIGAPIESVDAGGVSSVGTTDAGMTTAQP
ncbi:MAG TPA: hypothetical protein VK745_27495 [Polyangiaceae bacterium]|nr:hypothetical protein [Polyangiaceae bacterium]